MKKDKGTLLNSRKWKATLLAIASVIALFVATIIMLDRADPSYNRELGGLLDFPVGAIVTIVGAFMGVHAYSEKKSE